MTSQLSSNLHPDVEASLRAASMIYKVFDCDPALADTALFCEHYGFSQAQAANALITASKSEPFKFACCIVLATTKIDINKKLCQLLAVKKASFASAEQTMALTGMQIGGVTPFGLKDIPIYIDSAVMQAEEVIMGGGNRSSKVFIHPGELHKLANAEVIENLAIPK